MLLDDRHVLTCAHILPRDAAPVPGHAREWALRVDAVGLLPVRYAYARVADGCWVPLRARARDGREGDVAVLELAEPLPDVHGAPLYRQALRRGRRLLAHGFPEGHDVGGKGETAELTVVDRAGELIQLKPAGQTGPRVDHGYSGTGVWDDRTGRVVGMIVEKSKDSDSAWMMPIDTITGYLDMVGRYVDGPAASDPKFVYSGDRHVDDDILPALRTLTEIVTGRDAEGVVVVVRGQEAQRSRLFGLLLSRADPASRPRLADDLDTAAPAGTVPPVGSIDVSVDATGKTVAQVGQRIAERLGLPTGPPTDLVGRLRDSAARAAVLVDSVDEALDPKSLLTDLLLPLADPDRGAAARVLIGAREQRSISGSNVRSVDLPVPLPPGPPSSLIERLDRLDALIEEVFEAESRARKIADRFAGVPPLPAPTAGKLQVRTAMLRTVRDERQLADALETTERSTRTRLRRAVETLRPLEERDARHREQRGLLAAYQAMTAETGFAEEQELSELFAVADEALRRVPCDLDAAERAVRNYLLTLWRKLGLAPPEGYRP